MKKNRYANVAVVVLCLVISVLALAKSNVAAFFQDPERIIVQERSFHKNTPLEISDIMVKGKSVRSEMKFTGDDKWLRDITFKINNKYSKPITYVQVNKDFPEVLHNGVMMQHQLFLGKHPVFNTPINSKPIKVMPGESLKASLENEYDEIKRVITFLDSTKVDSVGKITLRLSEVGFEDGTIFSGGNFFKRNPDQNASQKWLKVIE